MGETTELIHRRIRHWKTTLAGVASILCPVAAGFFPQHSTELLGVAVALNSVGLFNAADAKPQVTETTIRK